MNKFVPGLIFTLCFFLTGCPAHEIRNPVIKPLNEVIVNDIDNLIGQGKLMQALQNLIVLENEGGKIPKEQILKMKEDVLSRIVSSFNQAMEKADFDSALRIFVSMKNIGSESRLAGWSLQKVLLAKSDSLRAKKNLIQALIVAMQASELGDLTSEEWKKILVLVLETRNGQALQHLKELAEKNKTGSAELRQAPAVVKPQLKEMMKGMATIWVDKGLKLEKGIGYPDGVMGSGFFIDPSGYLLTNHHVIVS
jgi:serine protease Do